MSRSLLLTGIVLGVTVGWITVDVTGPREALGSSDVPPAGRAGAPLSSSTTETTCSACHGAAVAGGRVSIQAPTEYTAGQTYTIKVTVVDPTPASATRTLAWGFELTSIKNSDYSMAGAYTTTAETGTATGNSRTYIGQSASGLFDGQPDSASWSFQWTAPAQGSGAVTFYAAGLAADGNGTRNAADHTYTTSAPVPEKAPTPVTRVTWGIIKNRYR
jgi:hypothetical protein